MAAAAGAVAGTGAISSALDNEPGPGVAARIESMAGTAPGIQAHASTPPAPMLAAPTPSSAGAWQIQVGAFRNGPAAEAQLRAVQDSVPELTGLTAVRERRGGLDRIRIGGIGDEEAARGLCAQVLESGTGCFVVRPPET